jgi:hypothetical protein
MIGQTTAPASSTDWTVVLTAGLSVLGALFGGLLGYLGARQQARVSIRQTEAENERLRDQHREDHLRNRQGTYHRFLTLDRKYVAVFRGNLTLGRSATEEEAAAVVDAYEEASDGVVLFGTESASAAVLELQELWRSVLEEMNQRGGGGTDFQRVASEVVGERREELRAARRQVIEAMRTDVAPG